MPEPLKPEELYMSCEPMLVDFKTTRDVKPIDGTIGQERAIKAIDFGLDIEDPGFNIYVLGESGTGKMSSIRSMLEKKAQAEPVPPDWCYVYNFRDQDVPSAVSLGPGEAAAFQKDMEELVSTLQAEISKIFESKEYEKQKSRLVEEFQRKQKELFSSVEAGAGAKGFSIRKTVSGLLIVPVTKEGEPLSEEDFAALDTESRKKVESSGKSFQERLDDIVRTVREEEKHLKGHLSSLEREAALSAVGHLIDELKSRYEKYGKITSYLDEVQEDILEHLEDFKSQDEQPSPLPFMKPPKAEPTFTRYAVNVLVNNAERKGAPCVYESNPTYFNLFGRIEHKFQYGVAVTDFSMIKAGSLHAANGGYIVIDAIDLLRNMFSYDALKRSVRNGEVKMEDIWEQYRLISTTALKPEAIPLNVKVILVGNPQIYYMLYNLDEEYKELFKVKADFDGRMERTPENVGRYVEFIASKCDGGDRLLHIERPGVARIIEYGSRLAQHKEKLTTRFSDVADLIRESQFWARDDGKKTVDAEHVERALNEKLYRHGKIEDILRELMADGTLIVETSGEKTGQVNGLAVLQMGDHSFGKPSRITASAYTGKAGVVNIERETKMSGKIHEKAVLIITNYLGRKYASKKPISLSASITFEQLYEMVEGDSATCAELYALLSSISGVPLKQSISVTGSMDQNGDVQPIGGVNEKIEGFFDLCALRGLDGTHGVIIPRSNVRHLMLKPEVLKAVGDGSFAIYPIDTMEEGIEILTGMPPGEMDGDGGYPEGTLNHLVMKRFEEITEALRPKKKDDDKNDGNNDNNEDDAGNDSAK